MATIQLEVKGLDELRAKLTRLEMAEVIGRGLYTSAMGMYTELRTYPPTLPNQRYQRTFKLRSGWFVIGDKLRWRVVNDASYSRDVQDREHQKRIFEGRWPTIQDVAERRAPEVRENVQREIELVTRGF